jgi:hypothetical protein
MDVCKNENKLRIFSLQKKVKWLFSTIRGGETTTLNLSPFYDTLPLGERANETLHSIVCGLGWTRG